MQRCCCRDRWYSRAWSAPILHISYLLLPYMPALSDCQMVLPRELPMLRFLRSYKHLPVFVLHNTATRIRALTYHRNRHCLSTALLQTNSSPMQTSSSSHSGHILSSRSITIFLFLLGISADMVDNVLVDDFSFQVNHTTKKTPVSFFEIAVLFFTAPRSVVYWSSQYSCRHRSIFFLYSAGENPVTCLNCREKNFSSS